LEDGKARLERLRSEAATLGKRIRELEDENRRLREFIEQLEQENDMINRELGEMLEEVKTIQDVKEEEAGGGVPSGREEISG
jgi:chromosome segregation ATPase